VNVGRGRLDVVAVRTVLLAERTQTGTRAKHGVDPTGGCSQLVRQRGQVTDRETSDRLATPTACSAEETALHIRCRRFWTAHQPGDPTVATATVPGARMEPRRRRCETRMTRSRSRAER
jgi:hypothetical protein